MRIIFGTDGSANAISAARRALRLLATADTITIVCAVEAPVTATGGYESGFAGGMVEPVQIAADWAAAEDVAAGVLERTAAALGATTPVELLTRTGPAGPEICRLAQELSADVVVVGSRGHGAIRRALLGSVSTHVVNNAPCPVLVIGAEPGGTAGPGVA